MRKVMKFMTTIAAALLLGLPSTLAEVNGGKKCAGCTVILGLVEQVAQVHAVPVSEAIGKVCSFLPSPLDTTCSTLIYLYGPNLIKMLEEKYTPDVICNTINWCSSTNGKTCNVFPLPKASNEFLTANRMTSNQFEEHVKAAKAKFDFSHVGNVDTCDWIP